MGKLFKNLNNLTSALMITALCLVLTVPFLGVIDFNTKGEPREALVVFSMIEGDWIFPFSENGEIPFKPPFFHWCILLISKATHQLNEFSSRLPSALAFSAMVFSLMTLIKNRKEGIISGLILLSMFETHRSAMACRVDMMLASCVTVALCSLYLWTKNRLRGLPVWAVIGMSLATLTKGPVGIVLPCMIGFFFALIQKNLPRRRILKGYFLVFMAALVIPVAWYCKAYSIAGDSFLNLVAEENLGRFFGRMSYESHHGLFFMPFVFLLGGTMPYSLLLLFDLKHAMRIARRLKGKKLPDIFISLRNRFLHCTPLMQFSLLTIAIVTLFYCIPDSKRSVYLLPEYPFIAYVLAVVIIKTDFRILKNFSKFIIALCCILSVSVIILSYWKCDFSMTDGTNQSTISPFLLAFRNEDIGLLKSLALLAPAAAVIAYLFIDRIKDSIHRNIQYLPAICCVMIFFMVDTLILPAVLNSKSDRFEAGAIEEVVPSHETIYSYCDAPMMRFFAINFYTGDRIRPFALSPAEIDCKSSISGKTNPPEEGYLLIADKDFQKFSDLFERDYTLSQVYRSKKKGCDVRDFFGLYKFTKNETTPE